jgi:hypothetical protein
VAWRLVIVTVPLFTVIVNGAEPPDPLLRVMVHDPTRCGVTVAVKMWPLPDGFETVTSAVAPLPHAASGVTVICDVGTDTVMVTFCAYAEPVPEKVSELGETLSVPGGRASPVGSGGGLAEPP